MFAGFRTFDLDVDSIAIHGVIGGAGPPLLLLHGYPQTHLIWHCVAPRLAERFTVVATDLRGYGDSAKPAGAPDHASYAKRAMAQDQLATMRALGFPRFDLCGHDRGARVAHRLMADHPHAVRRAMLLDIAPTLAMYEQTSMEFARRYWWWFFLIQPAPFPEEMILANPRLYLDKKIGWGHAGLTPFTEATYAAYLANVSRRDSVHAMCEDYRAAASIDLEHDRADRAAGHRIETPLRVLWGEHGVIGRCFRPVESWMEVAVTVTGRSLPCGHYLPEEVPDLLLDEMLSFFADDGRL